MILSELKVCEARVSYNGYYATFPRLRRRFDSAHPLKVTTKHLYTKVFCSFYCYEWRNRTARRGSGDYGSSWWKQAFAEGENVETARFQGGAIATTGSTEADSAHPL